MTGALVLSLTYDILILRILRTKNHFVIVAIEVEVIRLVRVRAYKRVRFGNVERVRSHYRRY